MAHRAPDEANGAGFWTEANRAAAVLSVGLLGDALLSLVLPVSYREFGITSIWLGILLSANRFIRIALHPAVTSAAHRFGLETMMVVGAILAALSTISYGLFAGGIALLCARITWGIAFASLRLGSLGYATAGDPSGVGGRLGRSGSIAQLGSLIAVTTGGWMTLELGPRDAFLLVGVLSVVGIPIALSLPRVATDPRGAGPISLFRRPGSVETTIAVLALAADGISMVTLTVLLVAGGLERLDAIATGGILLGLRQAAMTIAPRIGGAVADRIGMHRAVAGALLIVNAGLVLMVTGAVAAGFLVVAIFAATASVLLPGIAAAAADTERLETISRVVSWRDLGAATGALLTGSLLQVVDLALLYTGAISLLLLTTLWLWIDRDHSSNR